MFTRGSTWVTQTVQRRYSFTSPDLRLHVSFQKMLAHEGGTSLQRPWAIVRGGQTYHMDDDDGGKVVDDGLDIVAAKGCCLLAAGYLFDPGVLPVSWRVGHWSRGGLGRCCESSSTPCLAQRKGCCGRHCWWPFTLRGRAGARARLGVWSPLRYERRRKRAGGREHKVGFGGGAAVVSKTRGEWRCRGKPAGCGGCRRCRHWAGDVEKAKAGGASIAAWPKLVDENKARVPRRRHPCRQPLRSRHQPLARPARPAVGVYAGPLRPMEPPVAGLL